MPKLSGPSEILRANQKDEEFQTKLNRIVSEIFQEVAGIPYWLRYKDWLEAGFNMVYRCLTTLSNFQTLGEEYTGIFQIDTTGKALPKIHAQLLMVILNTCGLPFIINLLHKFEKHMLNLPESNPIRMEARLELVRMSIALRNIIPYIIKFHKTLFYFNGDYYEISKRLCGVRYALVRFWRKDYMAVVPLRLLAIFSVVELAIFSILGLQEFKRIKVEKPGDENLLSMESGGTCPLCLNNMQHTSITPCGHLFCWSCIHNWLQKQSKCPVCRSTFQASRVVFLQNYSNTVQKEKQIRDLLVPDFNY